MVKPLPKNCYLCGASTSQGLSDEWVQDGWSKWLVCPDCIRQGRALRADPAKQNCGGLGGPIDAFWDQTRSCGTCGKDYIFSAEEQRFWYETLGFFVESVPIQCQECRRDRRARKRAQLTLQKLLPLPTDANWRQLEEVARTAAAAGAGNALEYLRRAKNLCDEPEERTRLEANILVFKPLPKLVVGGRHELVEQLELHYRKDSELNSISDEERALILKAPGIPKKKCKLVARIDGMWIRPHPDLQDRRQLAYLHGEHICPNVPPHEPKVLIDAQTGVLLYLPRSGTRGQTGHHRHGDNIYGPPGSLPWI